MKKKILALLKAISEADRVLVLTADAENLKTAYCNSKRFDFMFLFKHFSYQQDL